MAVDVKAIGIIPLNSANYPTGRCSVTWLCMMKEELWGIVNGSESGPSWSDFDKYAKFVGIVHLMISEGLPSW